QNADSQKGASSASHRQVDRERPLRSHTQTNSEIFIPICKYSRTSLLRTPLGLKSAVLNREVS
ncbi:hypothetical protein, partial [Bartonella sp. CL45QHWL]|uniref:hypothetical protein n=1 Tax=Bartonella sp. CL45QHWL TaxID=3243533 RepID=UPI0035D11F20